MSIICYNDEIRELENDCVLIEQQFRSNFAKSLSDLKKEINY